MVIPVGNDFQTEIDLLSASAGIYDRAKLTDVSRLLDKEYFIRFAIANSAETAASVLPTVSMSLLAELYGMAKDAAKKK